MLYLWGKKAEGDLSRPFKTGGGLMDSLSKFHRCSASGRLGPHNHSLPQLVALEVFRPTQPPSRKPRSQLPRRTFKLGI